LRYVGGNASHLFYFLKERIMYIIKNSYAKINITLRVTGIRDDGYHNIYSLFSRINASERLRISTSNKNHDIVNSEGISIKGENIVTKTLRVARECGLDIPFLNISVFKTIPPGMGLGGGSGNAGAILDVIGAELPINIVSKIGADVPFFNNTFETAIVRGIGDVMSPVLKLPLKTAVIVPKWNSYTGNAYKLLDAYWNSKGGFPLDEDGAKEELERIYSLLSSGKSVGLLPNDFAPRLIEENILYNSIFDMFRDIGAIAWGITGSGASMFALYSDSKFASLLLEKTRNYNEFIYKVIIS
jgi:4-diphosphocytidyl-2-C-methyl-D-erythritol kinase